MCCGSGKVGERLLLFVKNSDDDVGKDVGVIVLNRHLEFLDDFF